MGLILDKPLFSIVTIMRNEEKHLPHLAKSLEDFLKRGGEWISLDTGSTDDSVKVAESFGCKVVPVGDMFRIKIDALTAYAVNDMFIVEGEARVVKEGDSLFDYASARNYIAGYATNKMIATPDCDEIYTKLDIDKINAHIDAGAEQFEYNFVFSHDELNNPVIQFMHSKFYDRRKLKWVGIIHEVLSGEAKRVYLDNDVCRLEHYQNVETNRNGYLTGLALDCFKDPDNDRNAHYFGRELMYKGRHKSAIKQFEKHISMNCWLEERSQSMLFIGDCHYYLGNVDESLKWYIKSFDLCPGRREPLMKLAEHYYRKNSPAHVIAYCHAALAVQQVPFYSNYQPYYENLPHELLYWAYWHTNNKELSKGHYDVACSYQPKNPKYLAERHFYYPVDSKALEFTGERVVPGKMENRPDIEKEHLQRYEFASKFISGEMKVLDAACGTGYGKDILNAAYYHGVDVSKEAIDFAIANYGNHYSVEDLENGICNENTVDCVVSFETIEHLQDPSKFLEWVRDHSKMFIFSIPVNMPSEFHRQVYGIDQIKALLNKYFPSVVFLAQNDDIAALEGDAKYIVGVAYTFKLPEISVVIPTLGREAGLQKCLDSIERFYYPQDLVEAIVKHDEPRLGVPVRLKQGIEESSSKFIVFGSNDVVFSNESLLIAITDMIINDRPFVAFNTGKIYEDDGNICEHFIISKSIIPSLDNSEVFCTDFNHVGVDNYLWAQLKKLGVAYRNPRAVVIHNHFSQGAEYDEVYKLGWSDVEKDRSLLEKKLRHLENKDNSLITNP